MTINLVDIDKIFMISVSEKRQKKMKDTYPQLVENNLFEWYLPQKDKENPERGCYNSHRNVINIAKQRNYKTIIVFEDDLKLLESYESFVTSVNNLERPPNYKYILLGAISVDTEPSPYKNLKRVNCCLSTVGYMVSVDKVNIPQFYGHNIDEVMFCSGYSFSEIVLVNKITNTNIYISNPLLVAPNGDDTTMDGYLFHNMSSLEYITNNNRLLLSSYVNVMQLDYAVGVFILSLILFYFLRV